MQAIKGEKTMKATKIPMIYLVFALLILCTGFISCSTPPQKKQSMDISEAKATMGKIVQRMEALKTEVSQMRNVMIENPKAVLGNRKVITLTPEEMKEMLQNMYQLVDTIGLMMSEIEAMVSNEELMMNEALKERALNLVDEMNSCVNYMDGIWSGQ
jgi:hypothetical protein